MTFRVDDTGRTIKGKHIVIYVGEDKSALEKWEQTGITAMYICTRQRLCGHIITSIPKVLPREAPYPLNGEDAIAS